MTDLKYGYNRDGEDLAQFNIAMFCDESNKLSLYFNRYNGSLTDKTNLSYVLENAKAVGLKGIKFVVDAGFISEECTRNLSTHSKAFTIGIPTHLDISVEMLKSHSQGIEKVCKQALRQGHLLCEQVFSILRRKRSTHVVLGPGEPWPAVQ